MRISNTGFDKCLCFLIVLALHKGVRTGSKCDYLRYQSFSNFIEINEQTSSGCKHVKSLVKIPTEVYLSYDSRNSLRDSLDLFIRGHGINFIMKSLSNLEY